MMKVLETALPGVRLIEPDVHGDARGAFVELYQAERYRAAGLDVAFVQDNLARSTRGVLRGLHLQHPRAQAKLVYVVAGEVLDVTVDVRVGSPTFGRHLAVRLDGERMRQLYVPAGFAHGYCVLSEQALVGYKCSARYEPEDELGVAFDDPALGIEWPVEPALVSGKDRRWPRLRDAPLDRFPRWAP